MKLKEMKKALKNIEKGAVTVSKKDKKYDITDYPEKWNDRKIVDSYKTEGKNGGITLVVGGKPDKKKSDKDDSDIDAAIERMKDSMDRLSHDEDDDNHKHSTNNDKSHDTRNDRADRKADRLIHDANQNPNRERRENNRYNNRRKYQNRDQRNSENNQRSNSEKQED